MKTLVAKRAKKETKLLIFAVSLVLLLLYWVSGRISSTQSITLSSILSENGYVEIRPPTRHVMPGTLIVVNDSDSQSVGVICGSEKSLGISQASIPVSPTMSTSIAAALDRQLSLDSGFSKVIQSHGALEGVEEVTLLLTNVKIVEITDEMVVAGLSQRSEACRQAVKLRMEAGQIVTMIKSALVADVSYIAKVINSGEGEISTELQDKLSTMLVSKISKVDNDQIELVGEQLIWGFRDDKLLARMGVGLPATGSIPDEDRQVFKPGKPIHQVKLNTQARLEIPDAYKFVRYDVAPLRQVGDMDCWATVYTMLVSWKNQRFYGVGEAMENLGDKYLDYWRKNQGLPGGEEKQFVAAANMAVLAPASYPMSTFVKLLEQNGPLWIISGDGISSHAQLLIGIFGRSLEEKYDNYETSIFELIDPATGLFKYMNGIEFTEQFESEARFLVDNDQDHIDMRWQILHL